MIRHANGRDEADGLHRWWVTWQRIECRCGDSRPRGVTCDCGFRPEEWEIDQDLQRRRRRVSRARQLLDSPVALERPPTIADVMAALSAGLDAGMEAVSLVLDEEADDKEASRSIAKRLSVLYRSRDLAAACSIRRPLAELTRTIQTSGDALVVAIETWLQALTRTTPRDAQAFAVEAQLALDDAGERIGAASARQNELLLAIEASRDGYLSVVARQAASLWQSDWSPPIELPTFEDDDEQWQQAARIWLSTGAALADLAFDSDAYWAITDRTVSELAATGTRDLLFDSSWRADYRRHSKALREVDAIVEAALAAQLGERAIVRAELQRYTTHVEGLIKFVLRTRLAVARDEPYAQQPTTLFSLLDRCLDEGWYAEVTGIDRDLRNATSHEDVDVDPGTGDVILDPGKASEQRLDRAAYLDRLLAAVEVLSALSVGLGLVVLQTDTEFAVQVSLQSVSPEDFAVLLLGLLGQPVETAEISDSVLLVGYAAPIQAGGLAANATAGNLLRAEVEAVVAVDGDHVLRVPVLSEAIGPNDLVAAVTTMRLATFDEKPVATATQANIVLVKAGIEAMGFEIRDSIARLRHLRDVAVRLECPDSVESITTLIAAKRQGLPAPLSLHRRMREWQLACEPMHVVTNPLLTA